MPTITLLYAGLLGLVSLWLSFQVGQIRGKSEIALGDGGNTELLVAMRRHSNFVEYVPLALVLLAGLEMSGISTTAVHAMGGLLLLFRICHAIGFSEKMQSINRLIGAAGTAILTLVLSVWAIAAFF